MSYPSDNRPLRRQSDNITRMADGTEIKRAAERGLLPFMHDRELLKAELLRRMLEPVKP